MNKKNKIASILGIFILGNVSGHHIDDLVEKYNLEIDRYPIKIEYSIIENCISSYDKPLKYSHIRNKKEVCICALDKTELVYDYKSFKYNQNGFIEIFENKSKECM